VLFDVSSESLTGDHAVVVGRRRLSALGHGNRDDPERSVAYELNIDPDRS
jgi:hypothetical protein